MKFRTEIEIQPLQHPIGYRHRILCIGSCFADHIGGLLQEMKFGVTTNPTGILFNPLSMVSALHAALRPAEIRTTELHTDGERWFHFGFHGTFADTDPQ